MRHRLRGLCRARAPPAGGRFPVHRAGHRPGLWHRRRHAALRRRAARASRTCAQRYAAAGYGHGHRAGLLLENRPDFFLHWFALNALGVGVVPINNDMRAAELRYLLEHSELCLAISLPRPHRRPACRGRAAAACRCCCRQSHAGAVPAAPRPAPKATMPITRDSECALLYTSGTTGRPKGCVLSNDYFLLAGEWYATIGGLCTLHDANKSPQALASQTPPPRGMSWLGAARRQLGADDHAAAADAHERHGLFHHGDGHDRRLPGAARPLPPRHLVAIGTRVARHRRALPGRDAGHAAGRAAIGRRTASTACASASAPASTGASTRSFEERFGFPLLEAWAMTETGAGAVVIANHEPRHVGTSCFGRAEAAVECAAGR